MWFNSLFTVDDGDTVLVQGTCACPVVASMITLINDARIAAGKKSVGEYLEVLRYSWIEVTDACSRVYQSRCEKHSLISCS